MSANVVRRRQRILALGLHLIVLALLALQVYVRRFPPTTTPIPELNSPEALWWGLWPATYLPDALFNFGAIAIAGLIVYFWLREFFAHQESVTVKPISESPNARYALLVVSALMMVAFFAFPIVHTRWGDSYIISKSIAWPTPDFRLTRTWQAPLDVFIHSSLWLLIEPYVGWDDATPIYRLLSPIAGAIYLFALLMLSRNKRFAPGWLTYGLVITLGLIQLFFGYVENYSFAAAMMFVYLWFGITFAQNTQNRRSLWPAATALAFANAFHPSTIVLVPSLLYLAWIGWRVSTQHGNKRWRNVVIQIVAPIAIVYGLIWIMMELGNHGLIALFTDDRPGGGDARWFVPLWETSTEWERYTMFSWPHLRDFVNEQLLIAPVMLPSLALLAVSQLAPGRNLPHSSDSPSNTPSHAGPDRPVAVFLVIAFLFYLVFTWIWNPDYGGQRDWDLFSLVAIPGTLLLVYALTRTLSPWRYLTMGALPLIAVQALHTAAWIYQNTLSWSWP